MAFKKVSMTRGDYNSCRAHVRKQWSGFPKEFKDAWCEYYLAMQQEQCPTPPPMEPDLLNVPRFAAVAAPLPIEDASPVIDNTEFSTDASTQRVHGYMLTWQGSWGWKNAAVQRIAEADLPVHVLVEAVKTCPFYMWLWQAFKDFCCTKCEQYQWQKKSGKMELCLRRSSAKNLVHFHLAVSDLSRKHRLRPPSAWTFLGSRPHMVPVGQRGRGMEAKLAGVHYYCQAPKIGSVLVFTNYKAFVECPVELKTVYNLWKNYKMDDENAVHQLRLARGRGTQSALNEIDQNRKWRACLKAAAEKMFVQWLFPMKPSKQLEPVIDWVRMFSNRYGKTTRFPFLVLNGESRMGKTRYAVNLFGESKTLVVPCQGAPNPDLRSFNRAEHKAIVLDEADHALVFRNKALFQAGIDQVSLGQSTCNNHAYSIWLYAVPLIVSTNDWMLGAEDHERDWLSKNSVLLNVTEPLWQDELMPLGNA